MQNNQIYIDFFNILERYKHFNLVKAYPEKRNEAISFINKINSIFNLLNDNAVELLRKSYFDVDYPFWWLDQYSKSSYYRRRYRAVYCFVLMYEVYSECA